jgi:hypothetical protein
MIHSLCRFACLLSLCSLLLAQEPALACDTPVYQYALTQWRSEPYPAVVFHREPLSGKAAKAVTQLQKASADGRTNVRVRVVDVEQELSPGMRIVWERFESAQLPLLVVLPPAAMKKAEAIWTGPPEQALPLVFDSPARREVVRRLVQQHQACIWVLLESGDQKADELAAATLEKELTRAPAALRAAGLLPPEKKTSAEPKRFSVLRVSRSNPEEAGFVRLLTAVAPRPEKGSTASPVAFPVFGRGRTLGYLLAEDMDDGESILRVCATAIGPCGCEVKAQNPGVDLLFTAAWPESTTEQPLERVPMPGSTLTLPPGAKALPRAKSEVPTQEKTPPRGYSPLLRRVLAGLGIVALGSLWLWWAWKSKSGKGKP